MGDGAESTRSRKVFRGAHPCRLTQKACHGLSSVSAPNSLSITYFVLSVGGNFTRGRRTAAPRTAEP